MNRIAFITDLISSESVISLCIWRTIKWFRRSWAGKSFPLTSSGQMIISSKEKLAEAIMVESYTAKDPACTWRSQAITHWMLVHGKRPLNWHLPEILFQWKPDQPYQPYTHKIDKLNILWTYLFTNISIILAMWDDAYSDFNQIILVSVYRQISMVGVSMQSGCKQCFKAAQCCSSPGKSISH